MRDLNFIIWLHRSFKIFSNCILPFFCFSFAADGYGSLDRSWYRNRTRGSGGPGGHKKRPDLMSADFTGGGGTLAPSPLAAPPPVVQDGPGTLEPLPEASLIESRRSPRRDWKPPLENTDVVGVMEAIEGVSWWIWVSIAGRRERKFNGPARFISINEGRSIKMKSDRSALLEK